MNGEESQRLVCLGTGGGEVWLWTHVLSGALAWEVCHCCWDYSELSGNPVQDDSKCFNVYLLERWELLFLLGRGGNSAMEQVKKKKILAQLPGAHGQARIWTHSTWPPPMPDHGSAQPTVVAVQCCLVSRKMSLKSNLDINLKTFERRRSDSLFWWVIGLPFPSCSKNSL